VKSDLNGVRDDITAVAAAADPRTKAQVPTAAEVPAPEAQRAIGQRFDLDAT
jgi:hypothetical protein